MLWLGTYEAKGGKGLHPLERAEERLGLGAPDRRIGNASFGAWNARGRIAYFVDEQEAGRVTAWTYRAGGWHPHGAHGTGGALPCYLSLDPSRAFLAVANYADGSVALIDLERETGRIGELADIRRGSGRGPDPDRQAGPHAHCAVFDEQSRWLYHVDLGLDRVLRYRLEDGRLGEAETAFEAPPGSGPRHLVLHPDRKHALLLCELSAELMLLERSGTGFVCREAVKTAPEPSAGNLGGHLALAPDGRVLATNRGHDSLVAYAIEQGRLRRHGWIRTGGRSPRHFHAGDRHVLVAHEESGTVTLVPMPEADADPRPPAASVAAPGAAFILYAPIAGETDGL